MQIDPFSAINYHLRGYIDYTQGNFTEAIVYFEKGISLEANSKVSVPYIGQALVGMGRAEEALKYFQQLPNDEPFDLMQLGGTTLAYAAIGDRARAKAGIQKLESYLETDPPGKSHLYIDSMSGYPG